jgi:hypothetical protein
MRPIAIEDLRDLTTYEQMRADSRSRIIDLRNRRRIQAGDRVSLIFENRDTVLYQVQEMLRAEKITAPERIDQELTAYNALLPPTGSLSATLFIEITDAESIRAELDAFIGLDRGEHVWFELGEKGRVVGHFAAGQSEEGRISSVQYVQFSFVPEASRAFSEPAHPVAFVIEHDGYNVRVPVDGSIRRCLIEDLEQD